MSGERVDLRGPWNNVINGIACSAGQNQTVVTRAKLSIAPGA